MAPRGYTTRALVTEELGVSLTDDQEAQVDGLIEAAEALIDRRTGRAWVVSSPATETLTVPPDGLLYLQNKPVTDITSVTVRPPSIGTGSTTLTAGENYELLDANRGLLLVQGYVSGDLVINGVPWSGYLATVVYTHSNAAGSLPKDIQRAATLIVAAWMTSRLVSTELGMPGVSRISFGQELSVAFGAQSGGGEPGAIPEEAAKILRDWRQVMFA